MRIDMHFHSKKSDGNKNPAQIVEEAENLWLQIIFCTDHDIINEEVPFLAKQKNISSAYWVEISSWYQIWNVHITYYSKNYNSNLKMHLDNVILSRVGAVKSIFNKLNLNWFNISIDDFYDYYTQREYNIWNLNIFNITNYIYDKKNYPIHKDRIINIFWEEVDHIAFLKWCLKRNWKYKHIWFPEDIKVYYPNLKELAPTLGSNYILSVAHPSFTFKSIEDFKVYLYHWLDYWINAIEINTFTPNNWIEEIISLSKKYNLYLTFWSDCHFQKRDEKHGDFWELNANLDSYFIDKQTEKYLNLLVD